MRRFLLSLAGILGVTVMAIAADKVEEGKPAPLVELSAASKTKGAKVNLADFKGKKNVVLFFYPKAMTGGWTKESCGFSGLAEKFAALDTVVFGISTDTLELQQKFVEKEKLETTNKSKLEDLNDKIADIEDTLEKALIKPQEDLDEKIKELMKRIIRREIP